MYESLPVPNFHTTIPVERKFILTNHKPVKRFYVSWDKAKNQKILEKKEHEDFSSISLFEIINFNNFVKNIFLLNNYIYDWETRSVKDDPFSDIISIFLVKSP